MLYSTKKYTISKIYEGKDPKTILANTIYSTHKAICKFKDCGEYKFTLYTTDEMKPPFKVTVERQGNGLFSHIPWENHSRHFKGERRKNLQARCLRENLTGDDLLDIHLADEDNWKLAVRQGNFSNIGNKNLFGVLRCE